MLSIGRWVLGGSQLTVAYLWGHGYVGHTYAGRNYVGHDYVGPLTVVYL